MTTIQFNQHADLKAAQTHHQRRIDEKAGAVRQRFARDWLLDEEYTLAANQAQAYADGGYNGTAPEAVQAWADAAGMSAQAATDDILATRQTYNAALEKVRRIRLTAKQQVAQVTTARAAFDAAETSISDLDAVAPQ